MWQESFSDRRRSSLNSKSEGSRSACPQFAEDTKNLRQNAGVTFCARKKLSRDTLVTCPYRGVKTVCFPLIDASICTDQMVNSTEEKRVASGASEGCQREDPSARTRKIKREADRRGYEEMSGASGEEEKVAREICTWRKVTRETRTGEQARGEPLDERGLSPTKLSEMINDSIKEAVRTIVKQCSMDEERPTSARSEKAEKGSLVYRSRIAKEFLKNPPKARDDSLRRACHVPRRNDYFFTCGDPRLLVHNSKTNAVSTEKIHNDKRARRHSKPASNVNTNNRRMTGNVNIYICSETNDNGQRKDELKLKSQSCTDTGSDTTSRPSNARHDSTSCSSPNRLINSIREKRRKLQERRQLPHFVRDKIADSADDAIARDNETFRRMFCETSPEVFSNTRMTVKLIDENVKGDDTVTLTGDGCCCKDPSLNDVNILQNSSSSTAPCYSLSVCNNLRPSPSWITIYPSTARGKLEDSDASSIAICDKITEGESRRRKEDICDFAIDENAQSSKPIRKDCPAGYGIPEECRADCERRNRKVPCSVNRNNCRMSPADREPPRQSSVGSIRRECEEERPARRRWSTCSCIVEEEENYCVNTERKELLEGAEGSSREDAKERLEKTCDYRARATTCGKLVSRCMTSDIVREGFAKIPTCESVLAPSESLRGAAAVACGTTLENSAEALEVTRVCEKFVTGELPRGIAICGTILVEPKGYPSEEAAAVCKSPTPPTNHCDSPEKTICKIPAWNSAGRDDVKRVSLSDVRDKLAKGRTNGTNLNKRSENIANAKKVTIQSAGSSYNGAASNNPADNTKWYERSANKRTEVNESSSNPSEIPTAPPPPLETHLKLFSQPSQPSMPSAKETPRNPVDQSKIKRTQLSYFRRPVSNRPKQPKAAPKSTELTRNLTSPENKQIDEEARETSKKEGKEKKSLEETGTSTDERSKVALLRLSLKKLFDAIKHARERLMERTEAGRDERLKTDIGDAERAVARPMSVPEAEDKIGDRKRRRGVGKKDTPITPLRADERDLTGTIVDKLKPSTPTDISFSEDRKTDTSAEDQVSRLKSTLLRIIAARRSRFRPFPLRRTRPTKAAIVVAEHVDQKEIPFEDLTESVKTMDEMKPDESIAVEIKPKEVIAPETISAVEEKPEISSVSETISAVEKPEVSIAPEIISVAEVKDIQKDVDILRDESRVLKDVAKDETTEFPATELEKESEKKPRMFVSCECGAYRDPADRPCAVTKYVKYKRTLQDCDKFRYVAEEDHRASLARCACAQRRLKRYPEDVSPKGVSRFYRICRPLTKEECRRGRRAKREVYSRTTTDRCKLPADCINCHLSKDRCCCAVLLERSDLGRGKRRKIMICLYCDKPRDKCECRGPIGRCSCCDLPADVCNCPNDDDDGGHVRKRRVGRPNESGTIRVTSWKPRREVERYFARGLEACRRPDDCRCSEKPKRQRFEELPYQRLKVFSNVMSELQRKMSESACCGRCGRNPCCCESQFDQDKTKGERRAEGYVRCTETEGSGRSPNNCRCGSIPKSPDRNVLKKGIIIKSTPIRRPDCACELSPCKCGRTSRHRKPLAKCYYCKSLPCVCITAR